MIIDMIIDKHYLLEKVYLHLQKKLLRPYRPVNKKKMGSKEVEAFFDETEKGTKYQENKVNQMNPNVFFLTR